MKENLAFDAHILGAALNRCYHAMRPMHLTGKIPPPDRKEGIGKARKWTLATIQKWNPAVADRCVRIAAIADEADA